MNLPTDRRDWPAEAVTDFHERAGIWACSALPDPAAPLNREQERLVESMVRAAWPAWGGRT